MEVKLECTFVLMFHSLRPRFHLFFSMMLIHCPATTVIADILDRFYILEETTTEHVRLQYLCLGISWRKFLSCGETYRCCFLRPQRHNHEM